MAAGPKSRGVVHLASKAITSIMTPDTPQETTTRAEPAVTYVALADSGLYGVLSGATGADAKGVGVMTGPESEAL